MLINLDEEMKRWEVSDTQVILANANAYYTKGQIDKMLEDLKNEIINQING